MCLRGIMRRQVPLRDPDLRREFEEKKRNFFYNTHIVPPSQCLREKGRG